MLSGDNGILQKSTDAKTNTDNAQIKERIQLAYLSALTGGKGSYTKESLEEELEKEFGENNYNVNDSDNTNWILSAEGQSVTIPAGKKEGEDGTPKGPNGKPLVNQTTIAEITETKIIGEDKFGNQVVIPEGFKLAQGENGSGDCVKDGIVIEDGTYNQYVWIPVSNINHDGSNKIKVNSVDEVGVEITLGRYTFDSDSTGNSFAYQYASSYATPVAVNGSYQELTTYRISNGSAYGNGTNTTARGVSVSDSYNGIQGFIESVQTNKGYYISRYEASYRANGKAASVPSTSSAETLALTSEPSSRTVGDLWNFVTQGDAATACYDLYTTVYSDLMNSYARDTAILYIQAMGNENYANQGRGSNTTLMNTGTTGDEKCKIFDMAANLREWTTEYCTLVVNPNAYCCVARGGYFLNDTNCFTSVRLYTKANTKSSVFSFRSCLYL